ncbi:hypothetical protein ACJWDR_04715 [Streptomyces tauricus]|uniref:hypothetical protein n=1 Tax=Streptomyces tauricus TaxID=68274 RepID=UPI00387F1DF8
MALTALLAEYNSLRTGSLQAISNRIQIMNFAFTSLAVVTAAMIISFAAGGRSAAPPTAARAPAAAGATPSG